LVVGGSGDIGSAVVRRLRADGWDVTFTFNRGGQVVTDLVRDTGAHAVAAGDLSEESPGLPVALGAFVNCIGINPIDEDVLHTPVEVFRGIVETNLVEAFRLAQLALPALISGRGTIVNISSIWGFRAIEGIIGYVASKHGMRGLTATLARECGPLGVTCNEVCPGALESRMMRACAARDVGGDPAQIDDAVRAIAARTPIGRLVTLDEVAAAVAFLCSRQCRGMNGASIVLDGGITA
jgi:NAD(P)-dependent dehydrogenase (short-subunit alcohol dehydrogenase family)